MPRPARENIYSNEIDLTDLRIPNAPREEFIKELEKIKYRGYEVESLRDGRKIVITKPGGKFVFGVMRREDFLVWVYNKEKSTLWLVSHKNIWEDLKKKGDSNPDGALKFIDALEKVYKGQEPTDEMIDGLPTFNVGESPELIIKAYKWIWGQEDANYPTGLGRKMSWEGLSKKDGEIINTGVGIEAIRSEIKQKL